MLQSQWFFLPVVCTFAQAHGETIWPSHSLVISDPGMFNSMEPYGPSLEGALSCPFLTFVLPAFPPASLSASWTSLLAVPHPQPFTRSSPGSVLRPPLLSVLFRILFPQTSPLRRTLLPYLFYYSPLPLNPNLAFAVTAW